MNTNQQTSSSNTTLNSTTKTTPGTTGTTTISTTGTAANSNAVDWLKKKTGTALKKVNRLEERMNRALGKAQRTEDQLFDSNVSTFEDQYTTANMFNKELNRYITQLKETQKSCKSFNEVLKQIYEPTWPEYNEIILNCQQQENYWNDYLTQIVNLIQTQSQIYLQQFPEYKKLIEKHDNKLIDYDQARHALADLTSKTSKQAKVDDVKLHKAQVDLREKQRLYEDLNRDLHMKLPLLYESRKQFFSKTFEQLFSIENKFHSEIATLKVSLQDTCQKFNEKCELTIQPQNIASLTQSINDSTNRMSSDDRHLYDNFDDDEYEDDDNRSATNSNYANNDSDNSGSNSTNTDTNNHQQQKKNNGDDNNNKPSVYEFTAGGESTNDMSKNNNNNNDHSLINNTSNNKTITPTTAATSTATTQDVESLYSNIDLNKFKPASTVAVPPAFINKVLYKVRATYAYEAKEVDELSFVKDDIIEVVEISESDKEDLDEGWLIGLHTKTNKRGLFPENFTKRC